MSNPKILMKTFGNAKEVRDDTKRQSMGGGLQSTPKDGVTIRLLTGPEGWARFSEYYDEDAQTFVPVVEGDTLPAGSRPSIRYVANALWQSEGAMQGKVVAFKMPKKVAIMLLNKMEKYGTLTDRDYEITKMGEGMNTDYDVTPESPSKVNLKKYELLDLEEKLVEEYNRAMGRINGDDNNATNDDDEEETPKGKRPAKSTAPAKKGVSRKQEEEEDDDEDDESIDFKALGKAADKGDDDAIEALTDLAGQADLDPDEYPTWAKLAAALEELVDDDEDTDEDADDEDADEDADEDDEDESEEADDDEGDDDDDVSPEEITAAGKSADKGDEDSIEMLTAVAEALDLDPDSFPTWAKLAKAINDALADEDDDEEEDDEEEDADDEGEEEDDDVTEIDADTLNAMSLAQLREFAGEYEIEHKGLTKKALIQAILDAAEE